MCSVPCVHLELNVHLSFQCARCFECTVNVHLSLECTVNVHLSFDEQKVYFSREKTKKVRNVAQTLEL
jgi:hypothetical protein